MCGLPGVRDDDPQAHDAALHQPTAEAPPLGDVRAQRHREDLPGPAPGPVRTAAQPPRDPRRRRRPRDPGARTQPHRQLQHAPPVQQGGPSAPSAVMQFIFSSFVVTLITKSRYLI